MAMTEAPTADLELVVRTRREGGQTRLSYTLNSPRSVAPFSHHQIEGPVFDGSPEDLHRRLIEQIEKLADGREIDGARVLGKDVEQQLASLGRDLWDRLFNDAMRLAYRRFRDAARTLLIITDEPWIPWEMIKPYDDDGGEPLNDPFFAEQFELTRWLAGKRTAAGELAIRQLAFVGGELPLAAEERKLIVGLADAHAVEDVSPAAPSAEGLAELLEKGGLGLLHVAAHGTFDPAFPDEAGIPLVDGSVFRPSLLHGPTKTQISKDRPLVFLNVCNAGQRAWSWTGLGGWADRWVRGCGCGAFVGPQWKVNDDAAFAFARGLYAALEGGEPLGRAVVKGREAARHALPGDPSWLAYTVYGHPCARVVFGDSALSQPDRDPLNASPAIREKIRSFDLLIRRKTEGFVGRQWLFNAIDGFVAEENRGYVQILGDPGIGKTSLIAEMVKRHQHPHHFNIRADGIQKPDHFLPSLCAQLVAKFGLGYTTLPPEVSRDASFLVSLLEKAAAKLAPGQKLSILVDALDESDPTAVTRGSNTLYLPSDLPDGVFFVVTSRRGGPPLRYTCAERKIDLQKEAGNNFQDVRLFTETWLDKEGILIYLRNQGLKKTTFVDEIVHLSEGNFMYLVYVLPEIEKGTYQDRKLTELPAGLKNYYEDHWQRMRVLDGPAWEGYKIPVLVALTIAKEPISMDLIAEFSGVKKRSQIRAALDEWVAFLQVSEVEEDGTKETRWRLYHDSFHDFIAAKDQVQDELVDLKVAHGKAADALWRTIYPGE